MAHAIDGRGRALSAAVRLALGAAFVAGCGGSVNREGETARSDTPSQDVAVGAPGATDAPPVSCGSNSGGAPTPSPLEGCKAKLRAAFGEDAGAEFWNPSRPLSQDPALVACCDTIGKEAASTEHFRAVGCCNVDVASNGQHCTPWGPPTPPSFVRRASSGVA